MSSNLVNASIPEPSSVVIAGCLDAKNDELLVSAAKSGDSGAFVELFERHSRKVLPRLYRIAKNREDAEDALQDAALKAFVHLPSFEGRSNFASWLTRIAINSVLLVLRKRRSGTTISMDQMCDESESSRPWEPPDEGETPEAYYARQENDNLLRNAVQRLPCIFRDAIEVQLAQEYSSKQVAEVLGISESAAKSRLMRARRTLQRRLSPSRPRNLRSAAPARKTSSSRANSKAAAASGTRRLGARQTEAGLAQ